MHHNVGVWIDHKKAVIVSASPDGVTTRTLESDLGSHARYSAGAGSDGQQGSGGEKKYEQRFRQHLDRYYDEVIAGLGQLEALLIFGPGEAKLELKRRLGHSKALSHLAVGIETADKLTDPQIVAKVKDHYAKDAPAPAVDQDMSKGAKEEDRPGPERSSHPGLDRNGLPNDPIAIAQDALGANEDKTQG